jgi:hypothetical protein
VIFIDFKLVPCSETESLALPQGLDTIYEGRLYRESYAPECWIRPYGHVPFKLHHDGATIGRVTVMVAHKGWHIGTAVVEDGPFLSLARSMVKPGSKISVGATSLRRYENADLRIVRHNVCKLEEVALVRENEIPGFIGAVVTGVSEPKPKPAPAKERAKPVTHGPVGEEERLYALEAASKGIIVRHRVGQVLGVR